MNWRSELGDRTLRSGRVEPARLPLRGSGKLKLELKPMSNITKTPIPDSYWVVPGRLLAGEYPGALNNSVAQRKVRSFVEAGISMFLDLTENRRAGTL